MMEKYCNAGTSGVGTKFESSAEPINKILSNL